VWYGAVPYGAELHGMEWNGTEWDALLCYAMLGDMLMLVCLLCVYRIMYVLHGVYVMRGMRHACHV
jgi:hypothetical protein